MACDHMQHRDPIWIKETCDWTGEDISRWEYQEPVQTFVDRGTHSYMCTQCKEVFYYSGRAAKVAEAGGDPDKDGIWP